MFVNAYQLFCHLILIINDLLVLLSFAYILVVLDLLSTCFVCFFLRVLMQPVGCVTGRASGV